MKQYLDLCKKVLNQGIRKTNRTGIDNIGYNGDMMKFDLTEGFPIVTTNKLAFKTCVAEMIGFLRGYNNAAQFRKLGCGVWDDNANKNESWLKNPWRDGVDHLGNIYGVQARRWESSDGNFHDQLYPIYEDLKNGIDNRREIVTHWNPGELDMMAVPPLDVLYQFGIHGNRLNLSLYQRSCDVPLGVPFNITGYAWLLSVMAHITGLKPGNFTHFMHDIHMYKNEIERIKQQIQRKTRPLPVLHINNEIKTLVDLETWVKPDDFWLEGYDPHPSIKFSFAV